MLQINNLSKKYGKQIAVDQVSFSVPDGRIGILLGPNGAGKSTIIKSIAGLLRYSGNIQIQEFPAKQMEAKRIFAYVPEMPSLFEALTVREHVGYLYSIKSERRLVQEVQLNIAYRWFCGFELADKQDKMGNELSKGMMQKVSICCALTVKPRVILLDEPMVGLDPKAIKELKEVVRELGQQGVTVLISTHMLEMVEDLWDIMFVMEKGHIIGSYTREEVGDKDLDALFFEMTGGEKA